MEVAEDEFSEVLDVSPDRHVDYHSGTLAGVPGEGLDTSGVAFSVFNLQTKPGARSAATFTGSSASTKAANCGWSRGCWSRPILTCASCHCS